MVDQFGSLRGKVCLVTGGTGGLGFVTARELARRGSIVVLTGRNSERCQDAAEAIRRDTGNSAIEGLAADLSSQAEVRRLAAAFTARHPRLDILINNAGALYELRHESVDGIEMTLALNHLAPFLLTNLLLDTLQASAPSRVVTVSSTAHHDVQAFDFHDPEARHPAPWHGVYPTTNRESLFYTCLRPWAHPAFRQYAHTKLANLLFTAELAHRLTGTGVTANALHPGLVATRFSAGGGPYSWFVRRLLRWFGVFPEQGAKTIVYLATSPEVASVTGQYFVKQRPVEPSHAARDLEAACQLWELSERMSGLSPALAP